MAWIELHDTLSEHPKTERLAQALKINQAWAAGILCCLWTWALRNRPDGDLGPMSDSAIARACFWKKSPALLTRALVDCGWLDEDKHIHNWMQYAGRLAEKRAAEARRKQKKREQAREEELFPDALSAGCPADVPQPVRRMSGALSGGRPGATVPNLTVPNQTQPNPTQQNQTQPDLHTLFPDNAWRYSEKARQAVAQRLTSLWADQGCGGDQLYQVALSYLEMGLSPQQMAHVRNMDQSQVSASLFSLCRSLGLDRKEATALGGQEL